MICGLCGREMRQPYITIGNVNVGPVCAKKRLDDVAKKERGQVRLFTGKVVVDRCQKTLDLFEEIEK